MQKFFNARQAIQAAALIAFTALTAVARAGDAPPADTKTSAARQTGAVGDAVKHDAKVVGAAVKDGAQKVGVAAKEVALEVADAAKKGAHEVAVAAKAGVAKTRAVVDGTAPPKAAATKKKPVP